MTAPRNRFIIATAFGVPMQAKATPAGVEIVRDLGNTFESVCTLSWAQVKKLIEWSRDGGGQ